MRAYADELDKPIERLLITHAHPDHFLGSEAFADRPVYALSEVAAEIAEIGQAEVDEKQADFGPAIAGTYVVPRTISTGSFVVDGIEFEVDRVLDAEAHVQLVLKVPAYGVIAVGDIVYSGVHLIMAGQPQTWIPALESLKAGADQYPVVLAGHGLPTDPSAYDANIAWLEKAAELIGTVDNADDFRQGLIDAFPGLGMPAAIDFVVPFLFPEEAAGSASGDSGELAFTGAETTPLAVVGLSLVAAGALLTTFGRRRS